MRFFLTPPPRGFFSLISLLLLFLTTSPAGAEDYEDVLDRGLRSDEPYSYVLSERARAENPKEKMRLLGEAQKFAPDLPAVYFELGKASLPNLFTGLSHAIQGVKAYRRNFWWSLSIWGLLYIGILCAFALSFLVAALIRLPLELPLIAHDAGEQKSKLLVPLLLVPFSLFGPLFFAAGGLSLAGIYMKNRDKSIVYAAMLFIALSPLALGFADLFFGASTARMRAIVEVNEGKENKLALQVLKDGRDFPSRFSYALALKREGIYNAAIPIYEDLLRERPDPRVHINLGNAYAAMGDFDSAIEHYEIAVESKRSASVLYNLSQIYRDRLEFSTGDKYFGEAQALDRELVAKLSASSGPNPNRLVVDERLTTAELWDRAREARRAVLNPFTVSPAAASAAAVILIALFTALDRTTRLKAFRCAKCNAVACKRCARTIQKVQMCASCYNALIKITDADPKERVARLLGTYQQRSRTLGVIKVLSFAPPGIAHIYSGRVLAGFLLFLPFAFSAIVVALNPLFRTGLAGASHGWLNLVLVLFMALMYLAGILANRRLQSGWL